MMNDQRVSMLSARVCALLAAAVLGSAVLAQTPSPAPDTAKTQPEVGTLNATPRERASFDAATGRNLLNYPPHRTADIEHMRLEIDIPDMNTPHLTAVERLRVTPIDAPLGFAVFDAAGLKIDRVSSSGRSVSFAVPAEQDQVAVTIDPPVPFGISAELVFEYSVDHPAEGLIWTTESPAWPGRAASLYSQGECESNQYWFVTHDFPNDRFSSELIVRVPQGFEVSSNGRLVSKGSLVHGRDNPCTEFHYVQERPHVGYLVSLVVGKFDVVDVGNSVLSMPVYVQPGQGHLVAGTFGRTGKMIEVFETFTGVKYPWDKYAQVCVTNFFEGGMENTSATTLMESSPLDETAQMDGDLDGLTSHELAHQWFGDLITCRTWEHIWLNEGFATYCEKIWEEFRDVPSLRGTGTFAGQTGNRDEYHYQVWQDFRGLIEKDKCDAPFQPGMVSKEYAFADDVFDREANPYPKGSSVLHMLRERLGDAAFFTGIRAYVAKCQDRSVETYAFRRAMEDSSGTNLQRFFDQWCVRPGVPKVEVDANWNAAAATLELAFRQTQEINGDNPAFDLDFTVSVRCAGEATDRIVHAAFDYKAFTLSVPLPSEPVMVAVNPNLEMLANVVVNQPRERWLYQLRAGPTLAARLQAAQHLGTRAESDSDVAVEALRIIVADPHEHYGLRKESATALGNLKNDAALAALAALLRDGRIDDARVRAQLAVEIGGKIGTDRQPGGVIAASALRDAFARDRSYKVRASALAALAKIDAAGSWDVIQAGLRTQSQDDRIRRAAIKALARVKTPEAIETAIEWTREGIGSPTRGDAARTLGKLAASNPGRVFDVLTVLARSHEPITRSAAIAALARVQDPRALQFLTDLSANAPGAGDRRSARHALDDAAEPDTGDNDDDN